MTTETLLVNDEEIEVEVKPLTIICHQGDMDVKIPNRVEIGSPATLMKAEMLTQEELDVVTRVGEKFFDMVFSSVKVSMPYTIDELRNSMTGVKHVVGMLAMIFNALLTGKQMFIKEPETHLHPKQQIGIAQMLMAMTGGQK